MGKDSRDLNKDGKVSIGEAIVDWFDRTDVEYSGFGFNISTDRGSEHGGPPARSSSDSPPAQTAFPSMPEIARNAAIGGVAAFLTDGSVIFGSLGGFGAAEAARRLGAPGGTIRDVAASAVGGAAVGRLVK